MLGGVHEEKLELNPLRPSQIGSKIFLSEVVSTGDPIH